MVANCRMSL